MRIVQLTTDNREHFKDYENRDPYFGTAPQALLDGFRELPEHEVHVVSCVRRPVTSPKNLAANIFYHSLVVPKFGWMTTLYQGCIRSVRRKLQEIQPDIVHGQGTERDCGICAVFSGFPNVLTIHGNQRLVAKLNGARPLSFGWLNSRLEAFLLPRTNGVVCITRYTREAVAALAKRTWLLPNAVDPLFFSAVPRRESPPLVLVVGLVCHRKNQNLFIRALDSIADEETFRVVFLGHVPNDEYGKEFSELLRTRPWCCHAGFADRKELREWFERASLVALPSLEDNCPMVVLEAMAANVPVVAGRVGGVPDLIQHGINGRMFDPSDAESIRSAVRAALANSGESTVMAAAAREQAEMRFLPRRVAQAHVAIYQELLAAISG
jgi:glycosyltransferase involved in cell wall biosynthesis